MNVNSLFTELTEVGAPIIAKDLQSFQFDTKVKIFTYLIRIANPQSRLIPMVDECSKLQLPSRANLSESQAEQEFTVEDYQTAFYEQVSSEVKAINATPQDLRISKDFCYRALHYLCQKCAKKKNLNISSLTSTQASLQPPAKVTQPKVEEKPKQQRPLSSSQQKPSSIQPPPKPISTSKQQNMQQFIQTIPQFTQVLENVKPSQHIVLQTIYTEQLYLRAIALLNNYQQRIEKIVQQVVRIQQQTENKLEFKVLNQDITEFLNVQELNFDQFQVEFEQMKKQYGVQKRSKSAELVKELRQFKEALKTQNTNEIEKLTNRILQRIDDGEVEEERVLEWLK
ncbi:Conserved_hypothetical protein [Hexamita inflata]|uniref:Uncharacterized protein n=1 Tax=Hexamita inflata TaxID=28002 RepID=A0AA86RAA3_9EUKA|nr:Conserved hypothetical protein [Hexamita inflata]